MYEMRILHAKYLVLQESRIHSLVLISLLTTVCLIHLILLIPLRMRSERIFTSITIYWHHHKVSLVLSISAELIQHV